MSTFIILGLATLIGGPLEEIQRRGTRCPIYRKRRQHFERSVTA